MPNEICSAVAMGAALTSDSIWFPALQAVTIAFALIVATRDAVANRRAGTGGPSVVVFRSEGSMAVFYGVYGVLTGLLVAISLSVEVAAGHRVFWALLDTALVAYVCLFNHWFRNWINAKASELPSLEKR